MVERVNLHTSADDAAEASTGHSTSPVLDMAVFEELLETLAGDLEVVVSIYRNFLGTASTLIGGLPGQDRAAQIATLHTLKGSSAMLGAIRLAQLAACLHDLATNDDAPVSKERIDDLTAELHRFRNDVSTHARALGYAAEI